MFLIKALAVAIKDAQLDNKVAAYIMPDPYKNSTGELCPIQAVSTDRLKRLVDMTPSYYKSSDELQESETDEEREVVDIMTQDSATRKIIIHLWGDINQYGGLKVYLYVL